MGYIRKVHTIFSYIFTKKQNDQFQVYRIGSLASVKDVCDFFTSVTHGKPSNLFSNLKEKTHIKYQIRIENQEQLQTIDSVYIFREGIKPIWEDQKNQFGCEYIQSLADLEPQVIDSLWKKVITCLVCEEFPHSKVQVNGLKICEKIQQQQQFIRIDLWLKNELIENDEQSRKQHQEIKQYLQQIIKSNFYISGVVVVDLKELRHNTHCSKK